MSSSRRRPPARKRIGCVSVYMHHGSAWVYYREGGRPVRKKVGTSFQDAERIAAQINGQLATAAPTAFSFEPISIGELRRRFLEFHEQVRRSSLATISRYSAATHHLVEFVESGRSKGAAHEISATLFTAHLRHRLVSPNGHSNTRKRPLRDRGVQYILEVCRSMYLFAQQHRHLPPYSENPFKSLALEQMKIEDAVEAFVFDEASELAFLQAADAWQFPIHFTLAKTGMRPGELCHLMIEDVDLSGGWLRIRSQAELGWSTKTRNQRNVPLVGEVRTVLGSVIRGRQKGPVFLRRYFRGSPTANCNRSELIELESRQVEELTAHETQMLTRLQRSKLRARLWGSTGAIDPDRIRTSFIQIAKRCGLSGATCPKSWRHTFATLLQDANVDPLIRQITLGHKPSVSGPGLGMTSTYTHSRPETQAGEIARAIRLWPASLVLATGWSHGGPSVSQ